MPSYFVLSAELDLAISAQYFDCEKKNEPHNATKDIYVLLTNFPVLKLGVLPINAFVILAEEPVHHNVLF
jgi:hypothetical protein